MFVSGGFISYLQQHLGMLAGGVCVCVWGGRGGVLMMRKMCEMLVFVYLKDANHPDPL